MADILFGLDYGTGGVKGSGRSMLTEWNQTKKATPFTWTILPCIKGYTHISKMITRSFPDCGM